MPGSAQPEDRLPTPQGETPATAVKSGAAGAGSASRRLGGAELSSALQLLVERTQYITGATGAALALPEGEEMVCRASSGVSAPEVGARLQVRSGLTGESMTRRQLLRCDNAEADPRVNLDACRALGIASIVVLPLLRADGELRGLFELFSDHAYAFEERDLIALERMAALTATALDLAEERESAAGRAGSELAQGGAATAEEGAAKAEALLDPTEVAAALPEAMRRVQKCAACEFPVSEGRTYCLDCEKKGLDRRAAAVEQDAAEETANSEAAVTAVVPTSASALTPSRVESSGDEFVPAFLINSAGARESWLARHVNLLAIFVLILGIAVVFVVFKYN